LTGEEEDLVFFREGSDGLDGGGAAGGAMSAVWRMRRLMKRAMDRCDAIEKSDENLRG
jgi:hypothetical protein